MPIDGQDEFQDEVEQGFGCADQPLQNSLLAAIPGNAISI